MSQFKKLLSLDLSNNPISDYIKLTKSLSAIQNLKELKLDLTTVDKVEIVLRNLPNLKILNGKEITPDLFSEDNSNEKNLIKDSEKENNKIIYNNNNDKIIIEKNELEQNDFERNETELPDSSIESEINNYDVSYILSNLNILLIENNATINNY